MPLRNYPPRLSPADFYTGEAMSCVHLGIEGGSCHVGWLREMPGREYLLCTRTGLAEPRGHSSIHIFQESIGLV